MIKVECRGYQTFTPSPFTSHEVSTNPPCPHSHSPGSASLSSPGLHSHPLLPPTLPFPLSSPRSVPGGSLLPPSLPWVLWLSSRTSMWVQVCLLWPGTALCGEPRHWSSKMRAHWYILTSEVCNWVKHINDNCFLEFSFEMQNEIRFGLSYTFFLFKLKIPHFQSYKILSLNVE